MNVSESNPEFEALLSYLKHSQGCNLTGYKRSTLMRRLTHRMQHIPNPKCCGARFAGTTAFRIGV